MAPLVAPVLARLFLGFAAAASSAAIGYMVGRIHRDNDEEERENRRREVLRRASRDTTKED